MAGDDVARFRFEIITSGTAAMNLQANGGEGYVDLNWTQDDFDLLAGFNMYRSTSSDGTYTRINEGLIPPDQNTFQDTNVNPGQPYFYKFTIVKTDMSETDFSNVASATPIDTIAPVINHSPVAAASPGLPLTLWADVTDNVTVQEVQLYYRTVGAGSYNVVTMVNTTAGRFAATISGANVAAPGLEYYLTASDGISIVQHGRPENPHLVVINNNPVVTGITPNSGPAAGGTPVTISGSNFADGASVTIGGAVCGSTAVTVPNQITCTTPAHFPAQVDVTVTNPGGENGSLLNGFSYQSETVSLSLPATGGAQFAAVQVPLNAANVQGLAAADLTITFDPAILDGTGATVANLTPGWSLAVNNTTPGELRLSMASPGGTVSGSGVWPF